jgi:hypothetical protein
MNLVSTSAVSASPMRLSPFRALWFGLILVSAGGSLAELP